MKNIKEDFENIDKIFIEISSIKVFKYKNNSEECDEGKYVFIEHISSKNPYISN